MTNTMKTGLELLAFALLFAGFFAINMRSGITAMRTAPNGRAKPLVFWLVQGSIATIDFLLVVAASLVFFGPVRS